MASPLSCVLACLFLEFLEAKPFKHFLPNGIQYFRYIDNILVIYPPKHYITSIIQKLNEVELSIIFTYELEKDNSLPFLDILITKQL